MDLKENNPRGSKYSVELDEYGDEGVENALLKLTSPFITKDGIDN